jgi:hypothetical protein
VATVSVLLARADTVVYDHFDAAELDNAWTVTLDRVTDWTYDISLSNIFVSDIQYDSLHGDWSRVILSQDFDELGDLTVTFSLGWDNEDQGGAMQNIYVMLYDSTGSYVLWASYHDAWLHNAGRISAGIGESIYSGPNNLPSAGQGTFEIQRVDSTATIYWESGQIITGKIKTPVVRLELRFDVGAWPGATFGVLSVDLISCEGTEYTPAENSTWGRIKAIYNDN